MGTTNNFLDEFLKQQLLDIGDEDARFQNLQSAAQSVANQLTLDASQLARYVRVGLDKDISPDEPVFVEIEEAITEHWKLIRNKHKERPVSIVRAVLWEAVRGAVEGNNHAAIVALTAKAESAYANMGPEAKACEHFLRGVVERVERLAEAEWTGRPELAPSSSSNAANHVNADLLQQKLLAACGPSGPDGQIEGANPHWPSANDAWTLEFSKRAAKGIADIVGRHTKSAQARLEIIASELATEIQNARLSVSRKTDLLWWSQSRYCITLGSAFSDIAAPALPFFLAVDFQSLAPGLCPQSADHFLSHVTQTTAAKTKKITVRKMIDTLVKDEFADAVRTVVKDVPVYPGRCGLLSAIQRSVDDKASIKSIDDQTLIGSQEVPTGDLAKHVFWELKSKSFAETIELGDANE